MKHPLNMFRIEIEMHGAAFADYGKTELIQALEGVVFVVENSNDENGKILDSNGNTVGSWTFE